MPSTSDNRGYALVSMLGPIVGIVAVALSVVWLIRTNWDAFPPAVQTGLKLLAIAIAVGGFVSSVWCESRSPGQRRPF